MRIIIYFIFIISFLPCFGQKNKSVDSIKAEKIKLVNSFSCFKYFISLDENVTLKLRLNAKLLNDTNSVKDILTCADIMSQKIDTFPRIEYYFSICDFEYGKVTDTFLRAENLNVVLQAISKIKSKENVLYLSNSNKKATQLEKFFASTLLNCFNSDTKSFDVYFSFLDAATTLKLKENKYKQLEKLELNVSNNTISTNILFDKEFFQHSNKLERLSISHADQFIFSEYSLDLPNLKDLHIETEKCKNLDVFLENLKTVQYLDLFVPSLENIPTCILGFDSLASIEVTSKKVKAIPNYAKENNTLHTFMVNGVKIKKLPEGFKYLKKLRYLRLGSAPNLKDISALANCSNLKHFDAGNFKTPEIIFKQLSQIAAIERLESDIISLNKVSDEAYRLLVANTRLKSISIVNYGYSQYVDREKYKQKHASEIEKFKRRLLQIAPNIEIYTLLD